MTIKNSYSLGWSDYQKTPQQNVRKRYLPDKLSSFAVYSGLFFLIVGVLILLCSLISGRHDYRTTDRTDQTPWSSVDLSGHDFVFALKDLGADFSHLEDHLVFEKNGERFNVDASLDQGLQGYILDLLKYSRTLQSAVVVLNPGDGRVLAMASYEKEKNGKNLCLQAHFPAASIFKIVSAAAALESAGFTPDKPVYFEGRKHTLYKRQLKPDKGKHIARTSFRKAFASSINPVFGKLGAHYLGREVLADSAQKFYFNQVIPFDLPVPKSTVYVPDDEFGLAEIASGFNKETLISPLHVALLVSTVANNGIMMRPRLVESVTSESGETFLKSRPTVLTSPVSRGTAESLKVLMRDTILYGTCRKTFLKLRRESVFRDVDLGAKTGTINDKTGRIKYNWFAAYALSRDVEKTICVAVLSVHGKMLGTKAKEIGSQIINYHLKS